MSRPRTKPAQLDLFGPTGRPCSLPTPQWRNLPRPTRRKLTELMSRLLMEHHPNRGSTREKEARNLRRSQERDDV